MLAYSDIISTPIETSAICARFSIDQVTLVSFMLAQLSPADWVDYDEYRDEIDALVAATQDAATTASAECGGSSVMWAVGDVCIKASGVVQAGWLECNGNEYNQADYPELYAAIGLNFGLASAGKFRVPDLRGRVPMGWSGLNGLPPLRPIGEALGENEVTLTVAQMPAHRHISQYQALGNTGAQPGTGASVDIDQPYQPSPPGFAGTMVTASTGGGQPHNNIQPSLCFAYHIYAGVGV